MRSAAFSARSGAVDREDDVGIIMPPSGPVSSDNARSRVRASRDTPGARPAADELTALGEPDAVRAAATAAAADGQGSGGGRGNMACERGWAEGLPTPLPL